MSSTPSSGKGQVAAKVKVCGIRTPEDLTAAEGADLIGVVIDVPRSPRNRSASQARSLFVRAEGRFERVAVLVDPDAAKVRDVLDETGADLVQLHGPLPPALEKSELRRVVPSLAVRPSGSPLAAREGEVQVPEDLHSFPMLHLDTAGGPLPGGTGRTPDWEACRTLVQSHPSARFLLGGGLTPENVRGALERVRPYGVDVSSGVESRPGEKSREKVERLLRAVREATPS